MLCNVNNRELLAASDSMALRWDVEEDEAPAEEHLELLARLLDDVGGSSGSDADVSDGGSRISQAAGVGLQWRERAADSDGERGERERSEGGEGADSEGELSYAASERVQSQLAGLRRKACLR